MNQLRVFVSYSREDKLLAKQLVGILKDQMSFMTLWDEDILPGMDFSDAIKYRISQSHLFMPLLTENSQNRPWVHQETGYAVALGIPVLPVAVNTLPGEMISPLHAISVGSDLSNLGKRLQEVNFEQVVLSSLSKPYLMIEIADWPEQRTEMMAQYANQVVVEFGEYGCVRQRGAFSSFSIPDKREGNPIWELYDGNTPRPERYHQLQQQERCALEQHARARGVYLIIDPTLNLENRRGPLAVKTRLQTLFEFLNSMPDESVHIVMSDQARHGNITIVGDWFVADSQVPREGGFRQTVFNRHAPTVLRWVRRFDEQFKDLCNMGAYKSRQAAMDAITERISTLL